jgi:acid stress chaperone HdeB
MPVLARRALGLLRSPTMTIFDDVKPAARNRRTNPRMRLAPACAAAVTALVSTTTANAQVTVDMAKITCNQLTLEKITDPQNIALWLSGYYHARQNNTLVDTQRLAANAQKIKQYCLYKPDITVMQAVEAVLAPKP